MRMNSHERWSLRLQSLIFYALLGAVVGLGGWFSARHGAQWDWSASGGNTLSAASRALLARITGSVRITAYARPASEARRVAIRDMVEKYQRLKPDIQFEFINPDERPQEIRELGISLDGELLLRYQDRSERVQRPSEQDISNALHRLLRQEQRWIVFLEGHGERNPTGQANFDVGDFGKALKSKGLTVQGLNLGKTPAIPANTSVLVVASPRTPLLPGELALIKDYLGRGGNLLLLTEPGEAHSTDELLNLLAMKRLPGIIVDATTQLYGIQNPTFVLVPDYDPHPVTRGLRAFTLFPEAAALEHAAEEKGDYRSDALASTLEHAWTETGKISGDVRYDENTQEQAGPLSVGLALYRDLFAVTARDGGAADKGERKKTGEQRVVVFGDGDFLSNQYLGNGANLDLGLAALQWLAHDDQLLDIPARTTADAVLDMGPVSAIAISLGFLLLLPLLLIVAGVTLWWRRRKR
jgi:ABC-type uncharacterized transport system involved in gliding motility auxiliary subunit